MTEEIIQKIVKEQFSELSFVYDDWNGVDRALTKAVLPACVCIMPVSGTLSVRNGRYRDRPDCYIAFLDKVKRDANGDDNRAVYERMKEYMIKFIKAGNESKELDNIEGEVPYDVMSEGMRDILTGGGFALSVRNEKAECL